MSAVKTILLFSWFIPSLAFGQNVQDSLTLELSKLTGGKGMVGFAVAIIDQERMLYKHGFGFSDLENKTPIRPVPYNPSLQYQRP